MMYNPLNFNYENFELLKKKYSSHKLEPFKPKPDLTHQTNNFLRFLGLLLVWAHLIKLNSFCNYQSNGIGR